jgi:hypothetical protein
MQEYEVAKETVLAAFPEATVTKNRRDDGPLEVRIVAVADGGPETEIWHADQRGLFGKNGRRDVPKIAAALSDFKDALTK